MYTVPFPPKHLYLPPHPDFRMMTLPTLVLRKLRGNPQGSMPHLPSISPAEATPLCILSSLARSRTSPLSSVCPQFPSFVGAFRQYAVLICLLKHFAPDPTYLSSYHPISVFHCIKEFLRRVLHTQSRSSFRFVLSQNHFKQA